MKTMSEKIEKNMSNLVQRMQRKALTTGFFYNRILKIRIVGEKYLNLLIILSGEFFMFNNIYRRYYISLSL